MGLTPGGVAALTRAGHKVLGEEGCGERAGLPDAAYADAGAQLVEAPEIWARAELLVKVKEPTHAEFGFLRPDLAVFSFLNLARDRELTGVMLAAKSVGIAYEHLVLDDGSRPLLAPMSVVSGRMAAEIAVQLLKQPGPGRGKLVGGVDGAEAGRAVVVGSGAAGRAAAAALGALGSRVTALARDLAKLERLRADLGGGLAVAVATPEALAEALGGADIAILAVLDPGRPAPKLLTREMVRSMGAGAVLVDVCIDQGGASETSRLTTHSEPTYVEEGVVHYCVANMPGAVPQTSTQALTAASLPYVLEIASRGLDAAPREVEGLARALSLRAGELYRPQVAEAFGLPLAANPYLRGGARREERAERELA